MRSHIVNCDSWYVLLQCPFIHKHFNSPSRSSFYLKISTFSGHLLSRILMFSDITDLSLCICSLDSFFFILFFISIVIALIFPCSFYTLERAMLFSEDMAFYSTCKSTTLLLISLSSSVVRAISCFCWLLEYLRFF